jgi:hypothetical protein
MIVTGGSVDTTVIAGGTEVNVESCTTAGSVCVDTLVLVNIEVAVMVLRISSVAQFSLSLILHLLIVSPRRGTQGQISRASRGISNVTLL